MRLPLALETPERSQRNLSFLLRSVLRRNLRSPLQPAPSAVPHCRVSVAVLVLLRHHPVKWLYRLNESQALPNQTIRASVLSPPRFLLWSHFFREKLLRIRVSCLSYILSAEPYSRLTWLQLDLGGHLTLPASVGSSGDRQSPPKEHVLGC